MQDIDAIPSPCQYGTKFQHVMPAHDSGHVLMQDATHAFRMDVSGTGIDGALSCPSDPEIEDYPPPPPPPPKPCAQGKDPYRGCPNLEWYFDKPVVSPFCCRLHHSLHPSCPALCVKTAQPVCPSLGMPVSSPMVVT